MVWQSTLVRLYLIMIKQYVMQLELRIAAIEKLVGNVSDYKESEVKDIRDGIADVAAKLNKEVSRKFERVKKAIDKFSEVIDGVPTHDKLTLVHSEIEELHSIASQLDRIQKLLPSLNTEHYQRIRDQYQNIHLLNTCSKLEESPAQRIQAVSISEESLMEARQKHRQAINEIAELNGQIVKNLSLKLQAIQSRKMKEQAA